MSQCQFLKHLLQLLVKPIGYFAAEKGQNIVDCQECLSLGPQEEKDKILDLRLGFRNSAVASEVGDRRGVNRDSLKPNLCLATLTLNLFKKTNNNT